MQTNIFLNFPPLNFIHLIQLTPPPPGKKYFSNNMDRLKEKPIDDQQSRFVEYLLVFLRVHTNQHFYTTNNQVYTNTHRLKHTAKLNSHLSLSLSPLSPRQAVSPFVQ